MDWKHIEEVQVECEGLVVDISVIYGVPTSCRAEPSQEGFQRNMPDITTNINKLVILK